MLPTRFLRRQQWIITSRGTSRLIACLHSNKVININPRNFSSLQESKLDKWNDFSSWDTTISSNFKESKNGFGGESEISDFFISNNIEASDSSNRLSTGDNLSDFFGTNEGVKDFGLCTSLGMEVFDLSDADTKSLNEALIECYRDTYLNRIQFNMSQIKFNYSDVAGFIRKTDENEKTSIVLKELSKMTKYLFDNKGVFLVDWKSRLTPNYLQSLVILLFSAGKFNCLEPLLGALLEGPCVLHIFSTKFLNIIIHGYYLGAVQDRSRRVEYYGKMVQWYLRGQSLHIRSSLGTYCILLQSSFLVEGLERSEDTLKLLLSRAFSDGFSVREIFVASQFSEFQKSKLYDISKVMDFSLSENSYESSLLGSPFEQTELIEADLPGIKPPIRHVRSVQGDLEPRYQDDSEGVAYLKELLKTLRSFVGDPYTFQEGFEMDSFKISVTKALAARLKTRDQTGVIASKFTKRMLEEWVMLAEKKIIKDVEIYKEIESVGFIDPGMPDFMALYVKSQPNTQYLAHELIFELLKFKEFQHEFGGFIYHTSCNRMAESALKAMDFFSGNVRLGSNESNIPGKQKYRKGSSSLQPTDAALKLKIGGYLINCIIKTAIYRVDETRYDFVFTHTVVPYKNGKDIGIIKIHPVVLDFLYNVPENSHISALNLPMLVPPKLWSGFTNGGYLTQKTPFVKILELDTVHVNFLKLAINNGLLNIPFSALNILGKTPWTINTKVLSVMIKCWNDNIYISDHLPLDIRNDTTQDFTIPMLKSASPEDYQASRKEKEKTIKKLANNFSQRSTAYYQMETAKSFVGKSLYFPHCTDFRGRAYPVPSLLNHMGSDPSRSILVFAEAKPLGTEGIRWLKIHGANVYGNSKISLEDRVSWIDKNINLIRAAAHDPFGESFEFWKSADKPWQFLSTCFEIDGALSHLKGPEAYSCRLPIHQDGSCNGLQHYAALGRDPSGSKFVNLCPTERPQDVYSAVAENMKILLNEQMKFITEVEQMKFYTLCRDAVSRKVVKQTIMTVVYGVTFYGAIKQIEARLVETKVLQDIMKKEGGGSYIKRMSVLLAKTAFDSLGSVFNSSRSIQSWLEDICTEVVASVPKKLAIKRGFKDKTDATALLDRIAPMLAVLKEASKRNIKLESYQDYIHYIANNPTNYGKVASTYTLGLPRFSPLLTDNNEAFKASKINVFNSQGEIQKYVEKEELDGNEEVEEQQESERQDESISHVDIQMRNIMQMDPSVYPMNLMYWTTPLGFPVSQPYRKDNTVQVCTANQSVSLAVRNSFSPVTLRQQVAAFPPNFIHSLDASHMMLTALACEEAKLTFASVHDSFWTHACDVPKMNELLRISFVKLHQTPVLENLYSELSRRYESNYCVPIKIPTKLKPFLTQADTLEDSQIFILSLIVKSEVERLRATIKKPELIIEVNNQTDEKRKENEVEVSKFFRTWKRVRISKPPQQGSFDINSVINSTYFFN